LKETRLVLGIVPYKLLNGDVVVSLVGGELRERNPYFFVWFASLSCFSSIFDLLPL
jgi:hypothetical protein